MKSKICVSCKIEKTLDKFHKSPTCKYGVRTKCKACVSEYMKVYHAENADRERVYRKEYNSRPETIEARKIYNEKRYEKPGALAAAREYNRRYENKPGVKEKIRERKHREYLRRKATKEA